MCIHFRVDGMVPVQRPAGRDTGVLRVQMKSDANTAGKCKGVSAPGAIFEQGLQTLANDYSSLPSFTRTILGGSL